jgi:hypothetical protein
MSIIWDLVSSLMSGLPVEKIVEKHLVSETVEKPHRNDPAHEERLKKLIERNPRFSDPIYKKNVQNLIERHRQFEKKE